MLDTALDLAAAAIRQADALLIGAGAGMGVDSGLPDFRGSEGFWKAYPPFHGRSFAALSTPHWFRTDSQLAWGFFGHRYQLYRDTRPHAGFEILRQWCERREHRYFVFTSNVDGHFQRAGFPEERVLERHGSIQHLQCTQPCASVIWPAGDALHFEIDPATIRTGSELPRCPHCHELARPNILMFDDYDWLPARCEAQYQRYATWLEQVAGQQLVAIEFGAGLAIPTVRRECERWCTTLIRVNPREAEVPTGGISLPLGALEAIHEIDRRL
ncbi:NAD-dependent protein deacetylase [Anatilimnocola aggregata]|uniref:protein acetyllysine N-acetyltransferase n=1 Tax=Anatilimnocola aggregata TaxID=2528021 RepID=A0A517YMP6_9BACT|nr:Sir2 family NAD-dependent protein deacetylase [Anatilimnocola aggregata]QDU31481.1 NAD-dependent protein deacetylase [Anatilimnocola aggregata]